LKRILLLTVILVSACVFAFGQSKDEQGVRRALGEQAAAIRTKNADALNRVWADDYTFVSREGSIYDKAGHIARLKSRPNFASFAFENVRVRLYGNIAVANITVMNHWLTGEKFAEIVTQVLVRKSGRWQVVAAHATLANDPK
jgi:ketosteroid isomerase-like protein